MDSHIQPLIQSIPNEANGPRANPSSKQLNWPAGCQLRFLLHDCRPFLNGTSFLAGAISREFGNERRGPLKGHHEEWFTRVIHSLIPC